MSCLRSERGAAMVFGLFFAVFLIACVYALFGTIETVLYRQRVQDAADAAAFSAAVVNARGMNLIALINMTMALVLSILVGLRLAETLGYIAIGVCLALSSVTFGATASAVPPLQSATSGIARAAEKVQQPIENVLKVLHTLSKVTSVVVPVGSNARVIDLVAARYQAFGVAIPARLTLPVSQDAFSVLCEHAGRLAGELAILPISPLLPDKVESKLGDVVGKITAAGSSWFCGQSGKAPDLNSDEKTRWVELPRFGSQDQCELKAKSRIDTAENDAALQEACNRANVEQLSSLPDRLGRCRAGEEICPADCTGAAARESCPPAEFGSCTTERAGELASFAVSLGAAAQVSCGASSPYQQRLALARVQCAPEEQGGRVGLSGFTWLERSVTREYVWSPLTSVWSEDVGARVYGTPQQRRLKDGDTHHPCGIGGLVGPHYEADASLPACESPASCLGTAASNTGLDAACSREPPSLGAAARLRERSSQVVDLQRCLYKTKNPQIETPKQDLEKDLAGTGGREDEQGEDSDSNTSPFGLEKGVMLGASDFQLRALVIAKAAPSLRQQVALAWWNGPRGDQVSNPGGAVASAMTELGRVGLAQAEYYFDWTGLGSDAPKDQSKHSDVTEWLWNMGWVARLRPFRLDHGAADATQQGELASVAAKASASSGPAKPKQALDCSKLPGGAEDFCALAQRAVELLGSRGER